jgi:hypothetical protein
MMTPRTYEITFAGEASPAVIWAFDGFAILRGPGFTTLRGEHLDQAALHGAIDRLADLRLALLEVKVVEPGPG